MAKQVDGDLLRKIQAKWNEMRDAPDQQNREYAEMEMHSLLLKEGKAAIVRNPDGTKRVLVPLAAIVRGGGVVIKSVEVYEFLDASGYEGSAPDRRKAYDFETNGKKYRMVPNFHANGTTPFGWHVIPEGTGVVLPIWQYPPKTKPEAEAYAYSHARGTKFRERK